MLVDYSHHCLPPTTVLIMRQCSALLQLYIPWNYHEQYPGQYTWDGMADVFSFIEIIQELELLVLLRVGPYICAEWDFGGLPWWLGSSQVHFWC